jgi:hypothetical protein
MRLVVLSLLAVLGVGCFGSAALDTAKATPVGKVEIVSSALGNQTLAPTLCSSGERQVFLGADFETPGSELVVRLFVTPGGEAAIRVFPASHPLEVGMVFRRQACSRFQLSLERTGWRVNDVYDLRVRLDFSCSGPGGDSAAGTLTADHCH